MVVLCNFVSLSNTVTQYNLAKL